MRQTTRLVAVAACALAVQPAVAQVEPPPDRPSLLGDQYGFYAGFRGTFMLTDVGDVQLSPSRASFGENAPGPEATGGGSIVLGYRWNDVLDLPIRTEVEIVHRFRHDFDTRVQNAAEVIDYQQNVSTNQLMVNVLYDFDTGTPWRPYVGAGIGAAQHFADAFQANRVTGADVHNGTFTTNFAYSVQAGVMVRIAENWALEGGYRFTSLGDVSSGVYPNGDEVSAGEFYAHDFLVGIIYLF
ncbi:MAG: porin family protein [Rhodospirillaceae bacterium]|nr:porin family protein [Rhodospirillaceae bacterium]